MRDSPARVTALFITGWLLTSAAKGTRNGIRNGGCRMWHCPELRALSGKLPDVQCSGDAGLSWHNEADRNSTKAMIQKPP